MKPTMLLLEGGGGPAEAGHVPDSPIAADEVAIIGSLDIVMGEVDR